MFQAIRKFSVNIINPDETEGNFHKGGLYPVLALRLRKIDDENVDLLVFDDFGALFWLNWNEVTAYIDSQ